jgi:hypothetical protein
MRRSTATEPGSIAISTWRLWPSPGAGWRFLPRLIVQRPSRSIWVRRADVHWAWSIEGSRV